MSVVQGAYISALPVVQLIYVPTSMYYNLHITYRYLGFSLLDELRSSTKFNHILFCRSLSIMTHNQQHIQSLQQLIHAPQPYNMNATQSCISNQNIMVVISVLNHKSASHSINQQKPHHNSHTKNVTIQEYSSRQQCNHTRVFIKNFYGRSEPIECRSGTFFSLQESDTNSHTSLHDFIHCTRCVLIQLAYVHTLSHYNPSIPQKLGFLNF
jgi:hypothetical protein